MIDSIPTHKILTIKNPNNPETSIDIYPYVDSESMLAPLSIDKGGTAASTVSEALKNLEIDTAINNEIDILREELTGIDTDAGNVITIYGVKNFAKDVLNTVQGKGFSKEDLQNLKACSDGIKLNQQNIGNLNTSVGNLNTNVGNLNTSVSNLNTTKVSTGDILSNKGKILKEKMPYGYGTAFPDKPEEGDIFFLRTNSSS